MRVLHVCDFIDPEKGGGTAERTYQMARSLLGAGVDCSILTTQIGLNGARRAALAGVDLNACSYVPGRFVFPLISPRRVRQLVAQADLVHAMGHWSLLNVMACRAARQLGKPYIVCPAGALEIFGRSGALKRFFNVVAGRRMVNEATRCFAITELEREQFVKYGVPRDRIVIVPNGIDPQTTLLADEHQVVEFRTRHGLGEAPFILFLGRLDLVKGPDLLLDAFLAIADRFEKYQLVFAGPDEGMKAGMEERLADSAYTGRVRFIGYLGGLEKSAAYAAACLLVVPSRREAMSLVALEAGFAGTPVLLTDQCGFDEIEAIGGGGVCAPTAVGIAKRMATLLAQSVNLHAMGTVLQRHINQYYTWPAINQRCVGIYKSLCAGGA